MNADTAYTVNLIQKGLTLFDMCRCDKTWKKKERK